MGVKEHISRVIEECDIILEVLDARDVKGTRSYGLETRVNVAEKQLLLVINKIDLIAKPATPRERHIKISATKRLGTLLLRNEIKRMTKILGIKGQVKVGVVGYANVGKSSVIRALAGKAPKSSTPGFTKGVQWIRLSKDVILMDSPGIIPRGEAPDELVLKGAYDVSKIKDPTLPALKLLNGLSEESLADAYGIELSGDGEEQLEQLAERFNYLQKGGVPDLARTARKLLRDWQRGKIKT